MATADESYVEGQNGSFVSYLITIVEKWTGLEILEGSLNYLDYLLWVFTPLIIVFILPLFIILFLYLSILFLHVYKRKRELKEAYSNNVWDGARKTLATLWDGHATIWHGYEVHGLEKIPHAGPALIVYYHGAIPVDYYYFLARVIIQKGRTCHSVADHFLFKLPGFKLLLEVFSVMHGPQEECVKALKNGHLLAISPGGVREALFSDETYRIFWRRRKGFAQVAIDAQVMMRREDARKEKSWTPERSGLGVGPGVNEARGNRWRTSGTETTSSNLCTLDCFIKMGPPLFVLLY
ncbi:DGAT1/2-independent enzyme synthesizing storage lipids isoform X3 [Hemitrygon akajei]|uniref:DGAT1/2-independent enzyme synthesizing storage lipids isoform X3 n=1 Tax=Hemitrygon akajei TaxID=2704970 RepID=UPI003BFA1CFF